MSSLIVGLNLNTGGKSKLNFSITHTHTHTHTHTGRETIALSFLRWPALLAKNLEKIPSFFALLLKLINQIFDIHNLQQTDL